MANYVVAFRGQPDRVPAAGEEQAWGAWFGSLGPAVVDSGHRVGQVRTLDPRDAGSSQSMVLTGYVVLEAYDLEAAAAMASGCPGLNSGASVEVAETVDA